MRRLAAEFIELALGRPTTGLAAHLRQTQHLSMHRIRALQQAKRVRILHRAASHTRYFRDALGGAPFESDPPGIALLTSREDLRRHRDAMTCRCLPGRVLRCESRGTTQEGVTFHWDRRRQTWDRANRQRAHAWFGLQPGDRELHLWPVDPPITRAARIRQTLRACRDWSIGERLLDASLLNDAAWREIVEAWNAFDPLRVTAYPSALCALVEQSESHGPRLERGSLRRVFVTGEPLFDWQRRRIEAALGAPVAQMYGVQEVGAIAYECPHGAWHVAAESVDVELIRGGRPARDGELAEVVATGLESFTMPVIRYCTGDIVRQESAACACGLGLPTMPPVLGRAGDFLVASDGAWVEPSRVVAALGLLLGDGCFAVRQNADRRIELMVNAAAALREDEARTALGGLLGAEPRLTAHRVSRLPRTASHKMRYVMSELSTEGLAQGTRP